MREGTPAGADRPSPRLLAIVGTRPEAIKLAPVALAAAARADIDLALVATGQHGALCHDALADFGLVADGTLTLAPHDGTIDGAVAAIEGAVGRAIARHAPDMLIVQGDTSSAYAAALAAHRRGVPLAHVEAGLRSYDFDHPFPEERNRVAIDAMADLLFAPTPEAAANLAVDAAVRGQVLVTGNTGIDALLVTLAGRRPGPAVAGRRLILVTCHRRENIGAGVAGVCAAVARLAARGDVRILLPLHPNPAIRAPIERALGRVSDVTLVDPLPYPAMVQAMAAAHLILSDSGGVQEEAPALGTPVLVLRAVTERPEALATGNLMLVGTDPGRIVAAATRLLDDPAARARMARPAFPYGDGRAAPRILTAIRRFLDQPVAFAAPGAQSRWPSAPIATDRDD